MDIIIVILIGVCIGLGVGLFVLYSQSSKRSRQLEREKATYTQNLTETQRRLEVEQQQTTSLTGQLTETQGQLEAVEEQRDDLSQQNKKTRWILYLSMVSLQGTGVTLLEEQKERAALRERHIGLIRNYKDLREDVKSKARRRLLKKGGEVILSFIPGLSLISLLSDIGEILEAVSAADDVVENLDGFADISEDSDTEVPLSELTPIVSSNITDVLHPNMIMDTTGAERNIAVLKAFVVLLVSEAGNLIASELAEEYPESISVTLDDLEEFIDELFEYHQTMSTMKENPPPREEGDLK